jgi:hypothetical protein
MGSSSATQNSCPSGTYCVAGSGAPVNCPTGSYNLNPNGIASSSCTPCPSGSWCTLSTITACVAGTYNQLMYQTSISACRVCPAGNFSTTGSSSCPACSGGYYWSAPNPLSPSPPLSLPLPRPPFPSLVSLLTGFVFSCFLCLLQLNGVDGGYTSRVSCRHVLLTWFDHSSNMWSRNI